MCFKAFLMKNMSFFNLPLLFGSWNFDRRRLYIGSERNRNWYGKLNANGCFSSPRELLIFSNMLSSNSSVKCGWLQNLKNSKTLKKVLCKGYTFTLYLPRDVVWSVIEGNANNLEDYSYTGLWKWKDSLHKTHGQVLPQHHSGKQKHCREANLLAIILTSYKEKPS